MLKAIRKLDRKKREGLLAQLVLSRGAPVEHPDAVVSPELREIYANVIQEVASTLSLDPHDLSPHARMKVNSFLHRELREVTFDREKVPEIRNRLGYEGILPPELYDIEFGEDFTNLAEPLGVSRDEVRRTILDPSVAEHYMPEKFGLVDAHAVSLFARHVHAQDPYTLLVDSQRVGAKIAAHYAIRIFHSDVDLAPCNKAVEMLGAFAKKYGAEFLVADRPSRFMFYERVPIASRLTEQALFSVRGPSDHVVDVRFTFRRSGMNWEIALAYAVDVANYVEALKAHGVNVRRRSTTATQNSFTLMAPAGP